MIEAESWYDSEDVEEMDYLWMRAAVGLAAGARPDDMPFGCVVVNPRGVQVAGAWGTGNQDPLSHSEMVAIHIAVQLGAREPEWLRGYTLYSTHEPCSMCCGAINHAKISRVVWGSHRSDIPRLFSPKRPAYELLQATTHPPIVLHSVLREKCIALFDGIEKWD